MTRQELQRLTSLPADELADLLREELSSFLEDEVLAILANRSITPQIIGRIAQTPRLTSFHSVRLRLVAHRQTPQAHAVKLVHYLYWIDLLRLSVDVQIAPAVRRAIDTQLLIRVEKVTLGEKISAARRCSGALIGVFLFDPSPRVFEALLLNNRLREDDLLRLLASDRPTADQLRLLAADIRWSNRYAIRKSLVLHPTTPRATAASQLRYLSRRDLLEIHSNPRTSVYLRRCIERTLGE
ncbi:MAG TPA: hypothetical protein VF701_22350 [Thermoanaerobaculia bacterium]